MSNKLFERKPYSPEKHFLSYKSAIALILVIVFLSVIISGCASSEDKLSGFGFGTTKDKESVTIQNTLTIPDEIFVPGCNDYYYRQLDDKEKEIYVAYLKEAMKGNFYCTLESIIAENYTNLNLIRVTCALQMDRNDILFLPSQTISDYSYYADLYPNPDGTYDVDFMPGMPLLNVESTDLNRKSEKLSAKICDICEEAKKYDTEYEKAVFVHNYICENAEYDNKTLEKMNAGSTDPNDYYICSAYGCLINKKCICCGYARGFQAIMNCLGIECLQIGGFGISEDEYGLCWGGHAWNAIRLDGEYYYVDITWDDSEEASDFEYFLIPTDELLNTHCFNPYEYPFDIIYWQGVSGFLPFDQVFDLPVCDNSQYVN